MMVHPSIDQFFLGWFAALVSVPAAEHVIHIGEPVMVDLGGGRHLPLVTCTLGLLGIVLSRPLAHKSEASHGLAAFLLVSVIMLITVELWIIESEPSWLFAFVVAIGLGFSGYSLVEMVGEEARTFISNMLSKATLILRSISLGKFGGSK